MGQPGWSGQWVVLPWGEGRARRGSGVPAWCAGPHRHTDTGGGGVGGWLSQCHQPPWNRKGWFRSNRHLLRRQSPGRLTGCLTLLGTGARASTTRNSMKGACREPGGSLPTRPQAWLPLLPLPPPFPQGLAPSPPLGTGRSPSVVRTIHGAPTVCQAWGWGLCPREGRKQPNAPVLTVLTLRGWKVVSQTKRMKDAV